MTSGIDLVPIPRDGRVEATASPSLPEMQEVLAATSELYATAGYTPPWICYLVLKGGQVVGTCGFKSAPQGGRVEIAYFTFPPHEGAGLATAMAEVLVSLALRSDPTVTVFAQTLRGRNASHRVLEKTGFQQAGLVESSEDGTVLEWNLAVSPRR